VTFTFDRAFTPAELATMAEEALEWVNTLVDPENPPLDVPRAERSAPFPQAAKPSVSLSGRGNEF
jgi:hypothetical protein